MTEKAMVLFSGGQDSAIALAWALERFETVETIGFDYRQNHRVELDVRTDFMNRLRDGFPDWGAKLGSDQVLDAGVLADITESSLTTEREIGTTAGGLPDTFVPGRNILFLTLAAAAAYENEIQHLVTGVGETDYSGYPDCREETMKALEPALSRGLGRTYTLHTPLMKCDKGASWGLCKHLGGEALVEMVREHTHSCYRGIREELHEWGYGCGTCPACELRARGWRDYVAWIR